MKNPFIPFIYGIQKPKTSFFYQQLLNEGLAWESTLCELVLLEELYLDKLARSPINARQLVSGVLVLVETKPDYVQAG